MIPWICTRCGGNKVTPLDGKPSVDDRFAVGWCDRCTPVPTYDPQTQKSTPRVRATIPLARDTDATHAAIAERDRKERERRIVRNPKTKDEQKQADAIRLRWDEEAAARRRSA